MYVMFDPARPHIVASHAPGLMDYPTGDGDSENLVPGCAKRAIGPGSYGGFAVKG